MSPRWILLVVCMLIPSLSSAAVTLSERDWQALKELARGGASLSIAIDTDLPETCTPGSGPNALFLDSDDGLLYYCDSTDNFTLLETTTPGISSVMAVDKTYGEAVSSGTWLRVGDDTTLTYVLIGYDATRGAFTTCEVAGVADDCDKVIKILSGKEFKITDASGNVMIDYAPNATTPKGRYAYGTLKPLKSVYLSARALEGDGTNCPARPTVVTISNATYPTFICTENNSSRLKFMLPMRSNWDGGTVAFKIYYAQTAADTGSVALEVAAACRALGTAFNGTYGTEVEVDDAALVGSGAIEGTLSAAITPNGTCAASDILFGYIDVDATDNPTTAAATLNFIGVDVLYSESSGSQ